MNSKIRTIIETALEASENQGLSNSAIARKLAQTNLYSVGSLSNYIGQVKRKLKSPEYKCDKEQAIYSQQDDTAALFPEKINNCVTESNEIEYTFNVYLNGFGNAINMINENIERDIRWSDYVYFLMIEGDYTYNTATAFVNQAIKHLNEYSQTAISAINDAKAVPCETVPIRTSTEAIIISSKMLSTGYLTGSVLSEISTNGNQFDRVIAVISREENYVVYDGPRSGFALAARQLDRTYYSLEPKKLECWADAIQQVIGLISMRPTDFVNITLFTDSDDLSSRTTSSNLREVISIYSNNAYWSFAAVGSAPAAVYLEAGFDGSNITNKVSDYMKTRKIFLNAAKEGRTSEKLQYGRFID